MRFLLLTLALILGSGAFLFHYVKLDTFAKILIWLKENKPADVIASTPPATPRGNIYDRNFRPLAATYKTYSIYARPLEMEDPAAAAALLEQILGFEQKNILASLRSERGFVWIAKGIDQDQAEGIKNLNIKGLHQVVETKRFYPNYETAAHAVGFVEDDQGLDGIEFHYNSLLRGDEISKAELKALNMDTDTEIGQIAAHLVLNLDLLIQSKIEGYLTERIKLTGATSGSVLLMDANTGEILGMASFPAFNPNRYWEFSSTALNNHVVSEPVYPGELALIFQQAAAINFKNERKSLVSDGLTAAEPIPIIEPEVLKRRKLFVAPKIDTVDPEYFVRFAKLLGFNQKPVTDIPLKNEISGTSSLLLTDPFYQVSALRLLTSFTALVNNGRIVKPHLLNKAYPREKTSPVEPILTNVEQNYILHPDTGSELIDFLAVKWLKMNSRNNGTKDPMFFEAHRFATPAVNSGQAPVHTGAVELAKHDPRILQSVMLGSIPGRDPKLTMIAVLSYPENNDDIYPDALESFGNKFSLLKPNKDMIQKLLYVAEQTPPLPSPDFWINSSSSVAKNFESPDPGKKDLVDSAADNKRHMPDVTGKSLRAGLQTLQHYNLDIRVVGNGKIVAQHPAADAELKTGSSCILRMEQDI
ncbi:MAG: PASTA domain-containing protein [Deltaproteobacteria bacterium]|nr:PASTA domain-containing protein [Deltaproteobacteria bacterium]